jgi:hypothetical protein
MREGGREGGRGRTVGGPFYFGLGNGDLEAFDYSGRDAMTLLKRNREACE